jgi:hypothetical protein
MDAHKRKDVNRTPYTPTFDVHLFATIHTSRKHTAIMKNDDGRPFNAKCGQRPMHNVTHINEQDHAYGHRHHNDK